LNLLLALGIGLGLSGQFVLMSRSLWAFIGAPVLVVGCWLTFRFVGPKTIRMLYGPLDEKTERFWRDKRGSP